MQLCELAKMPWYQDNVEILLRTAKRHDRRIKEIMTLISESKFKDAVRRAEILMLAEDIYKDHSPESAHEWLINACSFSHTVQQSINFSVQEPPKEEKF